MGKSLEKGNVKTDSRIESLNGPKPLMKLN